jgi:plasmid maintenance system antidote protein VapI
MAKPARERLRETLADVLRREIRATGQSVYAVALASGVGQPVLSRFLAGTRGITLDTADKLCQTLGLELRRAGSDTPS